MLSVLAIRPCVCHESALKHWGDKSEIKRTFSQHSREEYRSNVSFLTLAYADSKHWTTNFILKGQTSFLQIGDVEITIEMTCHMWKINQKHYILNTLAWPQSLADFINYCHKIYRYDAQNENKKHYATILGCKLICLSEYLPPQILICSTMNGNSLINILIISTVLRKQIFTVCAKNTSHGKCLLNCLDN